jgi:invasion protein IalB
MKKSLLLSALLTCFALPAFAAEQVEIGTFGVWSAYTFEENGNTVCYMAANPAKSEGKYSKRGEVVAMVTHRPAENTKNVFSYMAGYGYKKGSDVLITIDGKKFKLFTQNDMAWAADPAADTNLAAALQKGSKMIVEGTSTKGTKTKDTFSLSGSTKAYEAISKACGV